MVHRLGHGGIAVALLAGVLWSGGVADNDPVNILNEVPAGSAGLIV